MVIDESDLQYFDLRASDWGSGIVRDYPIGQVYHPWLEMLHPFKMSQILKNHHQHSSSFSSSTVDHNHHNHHHHQQQQQQQQGSKQLIERQFDYYDFPTPNVDSLGNGYNETSASCFYCHLLNLTNYYSKKLPQPQPPVET